MNKTEYQGYKAFLRGNLVNPYPDDYDNFERHRDWLYGFNKAYFENLKKGI
jgi:hypothetical protein